MSDDLERARWARLEREALEHASHHYGLSLNEPGADEFLRGTSAFAWKRLDLALRRFGRSIIDALPGPLRRFARRTET